MYCSKCGAQLSNDALFCEGCGTKVDVCSQGRALTVGENSVVPPKNSGRIAAIVLAISIAVFVVVVAIASAQVRDNTPSDQKGLTSIATRYYIVRIPDDWIEKLGGSFEYETEKGFSHVDGSSGQGIGCTTTIAAGSRTIVVSCFTDDFGPQDGTLYIELGKAPKLEGWKVVAYLKDVPNDELNPTSDSAKLLKEFSAFVQVGLYSEGSVVAHGEEVLHTVDGLAVD